MSRPASGSGVVRVACRAAFWSLLAFGPSALSAQEQGAPHRAGGEANLVVPDLSGAMFMGIEGTTLLLWGMGVCVLGLLFGLVIYRQLQRLPVHGSMLEISELIYETCKTYLIQQGKFLLILEVFIGLVILLYFGVLLDFEANRVAIILL